MKAPFNLNEPPYGSERCNNALRLALAPLTAGARRSKIDEPAAASPEADKEMVF